MTDLMTKSKVKADDASAESSPQLKKQQSLSYVINQEVADLCLYDWCV